MQTTPIGFVDADLLDGGTRFPNLALMKIALAPNDLAPLKPWLEKRFWK